MNAEDTGPYSLRPRRRFGWLALVGVAIASGALAVGGMAWWKQRTSASSAAPLAADGTYQCPMHPSVVQHHPGTCPICNMNLVRIDGAVAGEAAAAGETPSEPAPTTASAAEQYQCPMHPTIVQDHPGDCPICGMKLVKMGDGHKEGGDAPAVEGLATVSIDPSRQQLIGLRTVEVKAATVGGAWRTVGRVAVDETRVRHINLKIPAYVERVYVNFIGKPVVRGEKLFSIYSPELLAAQDELLLALRTKKSLSRTGSMAVDGDALLEAARRKLELWDVPESEIHRLEKTRKPVKELTFYSPISGVVTQKDVVEGMRLEAGAMPYEIVDLSAVWVFADVYESELRHVRVGMDASFTLRAYPSRAFKGKVSFIDPLLDPKTRTVRVRLAFPNPTGELRPEMFGEVVLSGTGRKGLSIPADAVLESGTKSVVFVSLGEGKFQPREVAIGDSDGTSAEVLSGLEAGERVVVGANFLVDSESRLRASLSALGSGSVPAHEQGELSAPKSDELAPSEPPKPEEAEPVQDEPVERSSRRHRRARERAERHRGHGGT